MLGMDLLTLKEAATRIGISPQTLMNWRSRNYGPPSARIGGRVRYRPEDIDNWIKSRFENRNTDA